MTAFNSRRGSLSERGSDRRRFLRNASLAGLAAFAGYHGRAQAMTAVIFAPGDRRWRCAGRASSPM
jgi:hypothetical protein